MARAIAFPGLLEIDPAVALALRQAGGVHVDGDDAEATQELSDLPRGDGMAPVVFRLRPLEIGRKLGYEVGGADGIVVAEGLTAVGQQHDAHGLLCTLARERQACLTGQLGPLAASEVGDSEKGTPIVGGTVVWRRWSPLRRMTLENSLRRQRRKQSAGLLIAGSLCFTDVGGARDISVGQLKLMA